MTTDWTPTACILCECNCGIVVQTEVADGAGHLLKIRGDKDHPASQGYTCNKALRLDHYQNNPTRLTSPMRRRKDGSYEEIDWDTAVSEIVDGFRRIADSHGGNKIFYYGGGGQGNHLGGAYSGAFLKPLGARYRSNALAQEKTGEAWVDAHLYGGHTRGEFEYAEVSVFIGKNPWMSQSFPRARVVLNDIAKDPGRSMIVIDPVVTDTAKLADFHLRVRPGTDAWCLAALAAVLVQENLCDEGFLAEHTHGADEVRAVLADVPIAEYAAISGVDEDLLRGAARRIAAASSVSVFEDLGVQQGPNSTLCSYLNKLLWILTGNFAKKCSQHLHSSFGPLFNHSVGVGRTPVTGAPIVGGLVPSNSVPQEILTDHPDRFRAMIVESSNPAHSIVDSAACRAAFEALELLVVIDVAMTEAARLAHYVLPGATQFEKPEATFFNLEFPHNTFQLRHPLFEPHPGTLPEPEIWARLVRALGIVSEDDLRPLREAAVQGRDAYTAAFFAALAANPMLNKVLPSLVSHPDRKIALPMPELFADIRALGDTRPGWTTTDFPIVLSAGERRAYTANDIFRDPGWRKRDTGGALRVSPADAAALGLSEGGRARITTAAGSAVASVEVTDAMQPGHASPPNGFGLDFVGNDGVQRTPGVAANELTSSDWRDAYAGTPWHKHVPARIEAVPA
jgi:formate dehydrogenase